MPVAGTGHGVSFAGKVFVFDLARHLTFQVVLNADEGLADTCGGQGDLPAVMIASDCSVPAFARLFVAAFLIRGRIAWMEATSRSFMSDAHVTVSLNLAAALNAHLRGGPCRADIADMKLRFATTVSANAPVAPRCRSRKAVPSAARSRRGRVPGRCARGSRYRGC